MKTEQFIGKALVIATCMSLNKAWQRADGSWWTNEGGKIVPAKKGGGTSGGQGSKERSSAEPKEKDRALENVGKVDKLTTGKTEYKDLSPVVGKMVQGMGTKELRSFQQEVRDMAENSDKRSDRIRYGNIDDIIGTHLVDRDSAKIDAQEAKSGKKR